MWRIVLATVFVAAVIVGTHVLAFIGGVKSHEEAVRKNAHAGLAGAKLLKEGAELVNDVLHPDMLSTVRTSADFLTTETTTRFEAWLKSYTNWREK